MITPRFGLAGVSGLRARLRRRALVSALLSFVRRVVLAADLVPLSAAPAPAPEPRLSRECCCLPGRGLLERPDRLV